MRTMRKLSIVLIGIAALVLIAATTVASGNPHQTYTCVKVKQNGDEDVRVSVPEPAVSGLTNAGFVCVADVLDQGEGEGEGEGEGGDQRLGDNVGPTDGSGQGSIGGAEIEIAQEARSLYCSTNGPAFRANGEGMGIALNLFSSQGALLVELGLAKPAIFYQGVGASCDVLPGFTYAGTWVDNVGDVVPGVAVYPLFLPTAG
jgi:hypothetical protein